MFVECLIIVEIIKLLPLESLKAISNRMKVKYRYIIFARNFSQWVILSDWFALLKQGFSRFNLSSLLHHLY